MFCLSLALAAATLLSVTRAQNEFYCVSFMLPSDAVLTFFSAQL